MDLVAVAGKQTLGRRSSQISQVGVLESRGYYSWGGVQWERMERYEEGTTSQGRLRLSEAGAGARQMLHMRKKQPVRS